ncbi:MAG TPA: OpgC domain-containing protein, partial [Methylomirabilota bacterium]|nr:OpgC domain-containing protein [Methylomirabilota bacterium]
LPGNAWPLWIPARFGFSDATEMFVFLSGMASAIAFGQVFDRSGLAIGGARVALRVWQVYWAHVAVFLVIAAMMVVAGDTPRGESYVQSLNLRHFFNDPGPLLVSFMTLTYVPNYFDILPMYLVILAMMPIMLAAERVHVALPFALMAAVWAMAQARWLDLPAEPWSERTWYFNPFGWQLLFYTGFFLMRRTLPAPAFNVPLMLVAVAIVVATVPFAYFRILNAVPALAEIAASIRPLTAKTQFGILRYIHFLALAYIAVHAVGVGGHRLSAPAFAFVGRVGQQSLAVFITGMVAARALGILLDTTGRGAIETAAANLLGFAILVAAAYTVGWFKSSPWKD